MRKSTKDNDSASVVKILDNTEQAFLDDIYGNVHEIFCEDPVVVEALHTIADRSQAGRLKYGGKSCLDQTHKTVEDWIVDALEEAMDQVVYLQTVLTLLRSKKGGSNGV